MSTLRVGLVCGAAALLLSASPVASQPSASFPANQPVALDARVALLEGRLHRLEQRLKPLTELGATARADGSWELAAHGARLKITPQGEVLVQPKSGARTTSPANCEPPYTIDASGIRRFKPECLSECSPPYSVDAQGIKRLKPGCQ